MISGNSFELASALTSFDMAVLTPSMAVNASSQDILQYNYGQKFFEAIEDDRFRLKIS